MNELTACTGLFAILTSAGALAPGTELIPSNQRAAVATLQSIAAAQARLRSLAAIDTDCDGRGEFGYFADLAGAVPMRVSINCAPGAGTAADILDPPLLPSDFGAVGTHVVRHEGYYFRMWLPLSTAGGVVNARMEDATGGCTTGPFPGPNNGERMWNCYAWPVDHGRTGNWAFFVNQLGVVFKCVNDSVVPYDGLFKQPDFSEAYEGQGNMGAPVRIGVAGGADNSIWTLVEPSRWEWIAANQQSAISTLRSIASAQAAFRSAVEIDTNCDGIGEYGFLAELAGTKPMRVSNNCVPAAGSPADILDPPLLARSLGLVESSCVEYRGYIFQMWLPGATAAGTSYSIFEDHWGGAVYPPFPDPINGSRWWCCFAWPVHFGQTGRRAYFINQRGIVLECLNRAYSPFEGMLLTPGPGEVYSIPGDMGSPPLVGVPGAVFGTIWTPVGP